MTQISFDLAVAAASLIAGLIGSLIGLGGGIIITPLLVLGFGIDIRYAMGAALCSVIATSSGAAAAYLKEGVSNLRIGMFLCIATTIFAVIGALLTGILNQNLLSVVFGIALLATVFLSARKKGEAIVRPEDSDPLALRLRLTGSYPSADGDTKYGVVRVVPGFLMMGVAGLLSGLLGIGSGAFKVLAMDQFMRLPFKVTTATSNFMIGVTAAASVGIYLRNGFLDPALAAPVALGVLVGAFLGARLLAVAPVGLLRLIFLIAVFLISLQMIAKGLGFNIG